INCNCDTGVPGGDYRLADVGHFGSSNNNFAVNEKSLGTYLQLDFNTDLWGRALRLSVDGLNQALVGDPAAEQAFVAARQLAAQAAAIPSIPGATRFGGPVKVADGVLDTFIADAPGLVERPQAR
ncbi:hypothetical protein LL974_22855, partial [Xanthomonas campestris pv. cannae]|nr:hypothetical protein [Xanthomonas campestris pv. cannae]